MNNIHRMYVEIWIDYYEGFNPTKEKLIQQIEDQFIEPIPMGAIDDFEIEVTDVGNDEDLQ